jgi:hypothetical protein
MEVGWGKAVEALMLSAGTSAKHLEKNPEDQVGTSTALLTEALILTFLKYAKRPTNTDDFGVFVTAVFSHLSGVFREFVEFNKSETAQAEAEAKKATDELLAKVMGKI